MVKDLSSVTANFVKGVARTRHAYIAAADGTVVKLHMETMAHETRGIQDVTGMDSMEPQWTRTGLVRCFEP